MHLYGDISERYIRRELPAAQLATLDAHVSNCVFCAHSLADRAVVSTVWERRGWLGRLARVETQTEIEADERRVEERAAA
jgi:hypothetical protein